MMTKPKVQHIAGRASATRSWLPLSPAAAIPLPRTPTTLAAPLGLRKRQKNTSAVSSGEGLPAMR
ncbi:unnamed protein product [Amoebophrya sp. A120]|nr:unnamed protein product [Amoebophrya sp. A120]|eukprot:GSA120T00006375001.1